MVERFFAAQVWLDGAWARDVLLTVGADGNWANVQLGVSAAQAQGATRLAGPVLPGLVNAHSHAFQRAIAGLTELAGAAGSSDDFWSWRDRMYSAARRITPEQLEHIAAWLYAELLAGGYTQVCEFHYLHQPQDTAGGDPLVMSMALVRAAQRVGMGLTLLPTLYMRSGFDATGLREDQRRFASSSDTLVRLVGDVQAACRDLPRKHVYVRDRALSGQPSRSAFQSSRTDRVVGVDRSRRCLEKSRGRDVSSWRDLSDDA